MKQMPKDTILFKIDDNNAIAYSYDYFKQHFQSYVTRFKDIFYKAGSDRNSWIDYRKTISLKTGTRDERILSALEDPNFRVNIYQIPDCYLNTADKQREYFTLYDGYYDNSYWLNRIDNKLNADSFNYDTLLDRLSDGSITQSQFNKYNDENIIYTWDGEDLLVTFPEDVTNSIISLNMVFYDYDELDEPTKVIFRNVKNKIVKALGFDPSLGKSIYDLCFKVYKWQDLSKSKPFVPVGKDGNYLVMNSNMDYDCFITYNGAFYPYEISMETPKKIKLIGLNTFDMDTKQILNIRIFRFKSTVDNMNARLYIHKGFNNRYKNSVDFLLPIANSLITYQGIDHEYAVEDDNAIKYEESLYSVEDDVTQSAEILSVNFIKG